MKKFLLVSIAALLCLSLGAQNSVMLKMNPEKNKVYRFRSTSDQNITQTVNGNQQNIESKSDYTVSLKVMDATSDFLISEIRIDSMTTRTNTMGKQSVMTSKGEKDIKSSETTEVISAFMSRLCKNPVYAKISYTGKVVEIINSKMISDIVLKDTASVTLTGQMGLAVKSQLANIVSENALKNIIETVLRALPAKEVKTGESWNTDSRINSGGMSLDIITASHLESIAGTEANITAESEIKAALNAEPMQQGGAKITYDDIRGLSKSTMKIDTVTGLVIEESSKSHISGNLGLSMPGMSMQIPMDINGVSNVVAIK